MNGSGKSITELETIRTDVLVVGSGIAGLSFARKAAHSAGVVVLLRKKRVESATNCAQGRVTAVVAGRRAPPQGHGADPMHRKARTCE